jgi:excisionase family DNA binding protein
MMPICGNDCGRWRPSAGGSGKPCNTTGFSGTARPTERFVARGDGGGRKIRTVGAVEPSLETARHAKPIAKYRWFCLCPLRMAMFVCAMPQAPHRRQPHQNDTSCSLERSDASDLPAWVLVAPKRVDAAASGRPTPLAADEWLTLAEVAQYLRLSKRTVSRMIKGGRLPAKRVGRAVRIARSQLITMLTSLPQVSEEDGTCRE